MDLVTEKYVRGLSDYEEPEPSRPDRAEKRPRVYVHERCGGFTQMPEGIRLNHLADPCFYFLGTICAECGGGVPESQCYWVETGENLAEHTKRLKAGKSRAYHFVRWLPVFLGVLFAIFVAVGVFQKGGPVNALGISIWIVMGAAISWLPMRFIRLFLCRMGLI